MHEKILNMHEKILNILSLCLKAKEKGHDVFFSYSPHAQVVSVCIYFTGWIKRADADERYDTCLDFADAEDKLLEISNRLVEVLDGKI